MCYSKNINRNGIELRHLIFPTISTIVNDVLKLSIIGMHVDSFIMAEIENS